jgi:hypothetical protein
LQFGKFHGLLLLILGIALLLLQAYFSLSAGPSRNSPGGTDANPVAAEPHRFPMSGFLGGVFVIIGPVIYFAARRRDEPQPKHAVK